MSERKLDIFTALRAMDNRDAGWLERQDDDARKEFSPFVFLRWASTVNDGDIADFYLTTVNERCNVGMKDMGQHPELLFRLAASCGLGAPQRHQWIAPPSGRRGAGNAARDLIGRFHPLASEKELDLLLSLHTRASFEQFTIDAGCAPDEAKEVMKAYDRFSKKDERPEEGGRKRAAAKDGGAKPRRRSAGK